MRYYICVDKDFPIMKLNKIYHSSNPNPLYGIKIFNIENIFEDLSPTDKYYIIVNPIDEDMELINGTYYTNHYRYIDRVKLDDIHIESLIKEGANPEAGFRKLSLIDWCIENEYGDLALDLVKRYELIQESLKRYINKYIADDRYYHIIKYVLEKKFNIDEDNSLLFLFAASNKKFKICKLLLELGVSIPKQVYIMYSSNKGRWPEMDDLLDMYRERIV